MPLYNIPAGTKNYFSKEKIYINAYKEQVNDPKRSGFFYP